MNKFLRNLTVLIAMLVSFAAHAEKSATGKIVDAAVDGAVDGAIYGTFSEVERQLIGDYFSKHRYNDDEMERDDDRKGKGKKGKKKKGMPPGLAKRDKLPPGLQKQLERNGTLPPGLAKRDLPPGLESQLPPTPEGFERVIADTSVVLVDKASGVIKDIIHDIIK